MAFSPDGKILASAGWDNTVKLWDVETGLQIKELKPEEPIYFQPSNLMNYRSSGSRVVKEKSVRVEDNFVNELFDAKTPLSKYLFEKLSPRTQGLIKEYHDQPTPELLKALAEDLNALLKTSLLYSEEKFKHVLLSSEAKTLLAKNPTGENLAKLNRLLLEDAYPEQLGRAKPEFNNLTFSHDGNLLAGMAAEGEIRIWRIETGAELTISQSFSRQIAFSSDDKKLAVIRWPEDTLIYDVASGMLLRRLNESTFYIRSAPEAVSFSPDGRMLLSIETVNKHEIRGEVIADVETDFQLRYWDIANGVDIPKMSRQVKIDRGNSTLQTLCASPEGEALVYEVGSEVKGNAGSPKVEYRVNLLKLDTGRVETVAEGYRSKDEFANARSGAQKVNCVFSGDGRQLAVTKGESLTLYSTGSGEKTKDYQPGFEVSKLSFSGDGSKLALASGIEVAVFDLREGKTASVLANHVRDVSSYFKPGGGGLILERGTDNYQAFDLTNGKEGPSIGLVRARIDSLYTTKKWNAATGECVLTEEHEVKSLDEYIPRFASERDFTPDRKLFAFPQEARVVVLDVKEGRVARLLSGHLDEVKEVVFGPGGKILASGSRDNTVKLWDVTTWKELRTLTGYEHPWGALDSISFNHDGSLIAATGRDGTVKVWDVATGAEKVNVRHYGVLALAFSPGSDRLSTAGADGSIKVWDLPSGAEIFTLNGHAGEVRAVGFSGNGEVLASGGADRTVKLWDVRTGRELKTLNGHQHPVIYVGFSNGQELISESEESTIKVWDTGTQQALHTFRGFSDAEINGTLSPDHRTLAVEDSSTGIKFWDATTGVQSSEIKWRLKDEHREIDEGGLSLFGDKTLMAFGKKRFAVAFLSRRKVGPKSEVRLPDQEDTYTIRAWELGGDGKQKSYSTEMVISNPSSLFFSADGKWLVIKGNRILIWNVGDDTVPLEVGHTALSRGPLDLLETIAINNDGTLVAIGDRNGKVELWDVATQEEVYALQGHATGISSLSFHSKKNVLMSQSSDGIIKFWDTASERELATLIPLDDDDWVIISPDGRFDASPNAMKLMHYVYGLEVITLEQIKDAYYEPGLLAKLIGSSKEPLRSIRPLRDVKLYPEVVKQELRPDSTILSVTLKNRGGGIGPVRIAVNGKTVVEDARDDKLKGNPSATTAILRFDLRGSAFIAGQENQITVTTSNYDPRTRKGYINSRGATIAFTAKGEKRFEMPKLYAIVGGISDYAGDALDLQFAAKDSEDFAAALRVGAEKFFGAGNVKIKVLSTTGNEGTVWPVKKNFMDAFAEVAREARPEDVLVIYLAGHGVSSGQDMDTYYYLTQEAQSASKESLSNPDVRSETAISSTELIDWLTRTEWVKGERGVKPLKQVMILDTCAAGILAGHMSLMSKRELSGEQIRAIERLKDRTGFHILMGSAADAVSYEATQYGQGLLTYALLQAMRGAKLRDGEFADVSELFQYAADEVPRLARDIGGIQRPVVAAPLGTSFDIGRFTKDEQMRVPLAQVKPLILTPRLIDPEQGYDDLGLEDSMRKSLRESSYAAARGRIGGALSVNYVFVDADEMPGAVRPSGTYVIRGSAVTVTLNLIRDGKKVASFQVTGDKDDAGALADKLAAGVEKTLRACLKTK